MAAESRIVRFLLTGDAKSALKAQDETAKGFEKTGKSADDGAKHIGLLHKSLEGIRNVIGYGGGILGLAGVAYGIKDVVSAGTQWQSQQAQLRNALKNTGQQGAGHLDEVNAAIERSATHGGYNPLEQTQGITQLLRFTGSATAAIKLNAAATNLARGAHIEYSQALKLVARAQAGTAGRAQQYLGIIQPVKEHVDALTAAQKKHNPELLRNAELLDKQATALEINRAITAKYAGATQAYSRTAAGAFSNFKNTVDLLMERLGRLLLPLITKVAHGLADAAQWVMGHWKQIGAVIRQIGAAIVGVFHGIVGVIKSVVAWSIRHKDVLIALGAGVGAVALIVGGYIAVTSAAAAVTSAWAAATGFLEAALFVLTSPISLIVAGVALLVAGFVYAYLKVRWFRDGVNAAFTLIKDVVSGVFNFIIEHWKLVLAVLTFPISGPVALIVTNFGKVRKGIEGVFNGIASFVEGVFNGVVNGVIKGVNLIIKAINLLIEGYNAIPGFLKPTGNIHTIGTIGEIGKSARPAPTGTPQAHLRSGYEHGGGTVHIDLHMDGHRLATVVAKNKNAVRTLTEAQTTYTLQRAART